ncbi:hypothetical protein VLF92_12900 [Pseudomonas chengduensis]
MSDHFHNLGQELVALRAESEAAKDHLKEVLRLLRDVVMHGEDAIDQRNGETVREKCRRFLAQHGDAL